MGVCGYAHIGHCTIIYSSLVVDNRYTGIEKKFTHNIHAHIGALKDNTTIFMPLTHLH